MRYHVIVDRTNCLLIKLLSRPFKSPPFISRLRFVKSYTLLYFFECFSGWFPAENSSLLESLYSIPWDSTLLRISPLWVSTPTVPVTCIKSHCAIKATAFVAPHPRHQSRTFLVVDLVKHSPIYLAIAFPCHSWKGAARLGTICSLLSPKSSVDIENEKVRWIETWRRVHKSAKLHSK